MIRSFNHFWKRLVTKKHFWPAYLLTSSSSETCSQTSLKRCSESSDHIWNITFEKNFDSWNSWSLPRDWKPQDVIETSKKPSCEIFRVQSSSRCLFSNRESFRRRTYQISISNISNYFPWTIPMKIFEKIWIRVVKAGKGRNTGRLWIKLTIYG